MAVDTLILFVLTCGVVAQIIAWLISFPSIVLFLLTGLILGPIVGIAHLEQELHLIISPAISLFLAIIIFEGSLTLHVKEIKKDRNQIIYFIIVNALCGLILNTLASHYILRCEWDISLLLGAILIITGPTVISPLLQHIKPPQKISAFLKWESLIGDVLGAIISVVIFEVCLHDFKNIHWNIVNTLAIGSSFGILGSLFLKKIFRSSLLPETLQKILTLIVVLLVFKSSNFFVEESGILSIAIIGISIANTRDLSISHIHNFKETLQALLLPAVFITIASQIPKSALQFINLRSFIFLFFLIFISRPATVFLATIKCGFKLNERIFLSFLAPRGVVSASIGSIFAMDLMHAGHMGGERLEATLFFIITSTIIFYSLLSKPLAKLLKIQAKVSSGCLVVGGHPWIFNLIQNLKEIEIPHLMVDINPTKVQTAKNLGINAIEGDILCDSFIDHVLDLSNLNYFLAMTSNDQFNALSIIHLKNYFKKDNLFQIFPKHHRIRYKKGFIKQGDLLFGSFLTFDTLDQLFEQGFSIQNRVIDNQYTYDNFEEEYPDSICLLVKSKISQEVHWITDLEFNYNNTFDPPYHIVFFSKVPKNILTESKI